jgi:serine/threonine protein kinase
MTPSLYYAKYRSKRSGSPSSVPASSTELQLPSRTTSKLICENRELARPESRVRTVGAHSLQYSIHETMLSYKFVQYGYYQRRYLAKLLMPDLQAENTEAWRNELDLLSKLQHPSLCPPIGAAPMHLSEFIQYDAFGPLYESVLALDESIGLSSEIFTEIFQALFVVADGLEFLHRQNITHGRLYSGSIVRNPNGDIFLLDYTTPKRIPVNWHSKQDKSVIEVRKATLNQY